MILVDAGSQDGTLELLHQAAAGDSRIRVIDAGPTKRSAGLNIGLRAARARYVANIDGDDPSHPERLEHQMAAFRHDSNLAVLGTLVSFLWEDEEPCWETPAPSMPIDLRKSLTYRNPLYHSSVVMKKESALAVGGYDETRRANEDYDLWVRIAASGGSVGLLPQVLASHRMHVRQSFESRRRLSFVIGDVGTQARAVKALGGSPAAYVVSVLRAVWAFVPRRVRLFCYRRLPPWRRARSSDPQEDRRTSMDEAYARRD